MLTAMVAVGVYGPEALRSMRYAAARLLVAVSFGIIGLAFLDFIVGGGNFWRSTLVYAMMGSVLTLLLNRMLVGAAAPIRQLHGRKSSDMWRAGHGHGVRPVAIQSRPMEKTRPRCGALLGAKGGV
jgi:hypothetical protein